MTVHAVPLGTNICCSNIPLFGERSGPLGVVEEGRNYGLKKELGGSSYWPSLRKEHTRLNSRLRWCWLIQDYIGSKSQKRRKWQPTPVFLPGEFQGQRSLVGCRLWGRTESNMTEVT